MSNDFRTIYMNPTRIVTSSIVHSKPCYLGRLLVGTDGVNDPVVAIYNNTSVVAADRVIPSVTYDASALGLNGVVLQFAERLDTGLYIAISNIGSGEVIVSSRLIEDVPDQALK